MDKRNLAEEASASSQFFITWMSEMEAADRAAMMASLMNSAYWMLLDFARQAKTTGAEGYTKRTYRELMEAALKCANLRNAILKSAQEDYDGELCDWGLGGSARQAAEADAARGASAHLREGAGTDELDGGATAPAALDSEHV